MLSFSRLPDRVAAFAAAALLAGCGVPERIPLPAPVPLTQGGTVVPAHGAGLGIDFGDGFLGQELLRTEILAVGVIGGLGDRVGVALYSFNETRQNDQGGTFIRAKVRAGPLLGPKSSVAAAFAYSTSSRVSADLQDERVTALDLAIPAERLLAASADGWHELSVYLGPRIIFENYDDRLTPGESLEATHAGGLAGIHGRAGRFHLFGELNFLHFPGRVVRGQPYDSGWMVIPSVGIALHFGPSHRWGK
jgi:hypothetical protein